MNRRKFVKTTALIAAGTATAIAPGYTKIIDSGNPDNIITGPLKRVLGKTGFQVTTLGLGGQASLEWTPVDVDPVKIILKAFDLGVNYFDTANGYGPSQQNYGKAFQQLNLIPGLPGYDDMLRKSIFLNSKSTSRNAIGIVPQLRRSLSQIFGDGLGNYPNGAYLDMMLFHDLRSKSEVDAIFYGLDNPSPNDNKTGAFAALRDFRDRTNLTGLNPANEKLVHHIGFSGHYDPSVNMYMIQCDRKNLLDAMLVSVNANDKLYYNMQYNVIPLASAKNMGVIAMKVFADGAMYTKAATWSSGPAHVIRTIGNESLPSSSLIRYTLTTPGVHLVIIGIGQISDNQLECQLFNNLNGAQVLPDGLTEAERSSIEAKAAIEKGGSTNYFQIAAKPLTAPTEVNVTQTVLNNVRDAFVSWNTAYAGDAPLISYEIWRDGTKIMEIPYAPQITLDPFRISETLNDNLSHTYYVQVVDAKGRTAKSLSVTLPPGVITNVTNAGDETESIKIIQTSNEIKIKLSNDFVSWKACLYNLQGSQVISKLVESDIIVFDISSLSSGMYFIVLSNGTRRLVEKVIKP